MMLNLAKLVMKIRYQAKTAPDITDRTQTAQTLTAPDKTAPNSKLIRPKTASKKCSDPKLPHSQNCQRPKIPQIQNCPKSKTVPDIMTLVSNKNICEQNE